MNINFVLLEDFEFNVDKDDRNANDTKSDANYNATFGYGISHPDELPLDATIFIRMELAFFRDDKKLYNAACVFQVSLIDAKIEEVESPAFHIEVLKEIFEKFSTLHNIAVSQTPWRKAIISDEELHNLIKQIKSEEAKESETTRDELPNPKD